MRRLAVRLLEFSFSADYNERLLGKIFLKNQDEKMKKKQNWFFLGLCWTGCLFACLTPSALGKTIYVDSAASESTGTADGTEAHPFASLEDARAAARPFVGKEQVEILVKAGVYRLAQPLTLSREDGGTKDAPVIYRSIEPRAAHLAGSVVLDGTQFRVTEDPAVLARLPESVRGKIVEFDLNTVGIEKLDLPGVHCRMPLPVPELFVEGERMRLARWPNEGWTTVAKIVDGGSKAGSGNAFDAAKMNEKIEPPRGGTFEYSDDAPNRWNAENGVWLWGYWCFDWFDDIVKVASIDPEKKWISFAGQSNYGLRQGNPSPRRWRAIHLLEELDIPGEYFVDFQTRRLYFYPNGTLENVNVTLAFRNQPVIRIQEAQHVTFEGFVIEESFVDGVVCRNASFLTFRNCVVRNMRQCGIYSEGGEENHFLGNLIQFTGTGGLSVFSGDRKTLKRGNCLIENNVIHDFSVHRLCYASAVTVGGVGHVIRHNELFNAPHMAVALGGNDMIFELNRIHHVCLTGDDAAALYKGRDPSKRGNVIRWNYWHDIGSPRGHGNAAVYFDDGDGGEMVFGNIFVNCGDPGKGSFGTVFCHGGHGNFAENNIFVDCKRPLGSAPWNDQRWKEYIDAPLWQKRLLEDVDITSETYLTAYPELKGFMEGAPIAQRHNFSKKNVFIRPAMEPSGTWDLHETDVTLDHDPGFVDAENGNYGLRGDSEIFRLIPDFEPIPFEKIGPQR